MTHPSSTAACFVILNDLLDLAKMIPAYEDREAAQKTSDDFESSLKPLWPILAQAPNETAARVIAALPEIAEWRLCSSLTAFYNLGMAPAGVFVRSPEDVDRLIMPLTSMVKDNDRLRARAVSILNDLTWENFSAAPQVVDAIAATMPALVNDYTACGQAFACLANMGLGDETQCARAFDLIVSYMIQPPCQNDPNIGQSGAYALCRLAGSDPAQVARAIEVIGENLVTVLTAERLVDDASISMITCLQTLGDAAPEHAAAAAHAIGRAERIIANPGDSGPPVHVLSR